MLVPMTKVHVVGHRRRLDATLETLHRLGCVHVIDVTDDSDVKLAPLAIDEKHLHEIEELRFLRARVDALLALVSVEPPEPAAPAALPDLAVLRRSLDEHGPVIEGLMRHIDELEALQETLPRHIASLRRLLPLLPELTELEGYETSALLIESRHTDVLGELHAALAEMLGGNFDIISDQVDADMVGAILVFPRDRADDVSTLLGRERVSRVRLPQHFEAMPFRQAISAMEARLVVLPAEIDQLRDQLLDVIRPQTAWVEASRCLRARLDQLSVIRHLGATASTFSLSGWVPAEAVAGVRRALLEEVGEEVIVEEMAAAPNERPPVLMRNPAPARPFEFLVKLLALPKYGSLDPTTLMTIFLPLFFGIMLGDIAYGVVLLALAIFVVRRFAGRSQTIRDLGRIFILSAGWTVVWGVIYGEFLGDLGHRWFGLSPLWINREEALEELLIFAIAVGAAHITLGLALGIWEAVRGRDTRQLAERVGLLIALAGMFLIAGVASQQLPSGFMTPGVAAIVVGLVLLIALGGPMGALMGPLELIGTIGNVLSYLRLAAIGLASVFLARIANELGAAGPIWLGIIIAALFHALNLALGAFSPTIQALRLHYVEFFGKFYEQGGEAFQPFGGAPPPAGDRRGRPERQQAPRDRLHETTTNKPV